MNTDIYNEDELVPPSWLTKDFLEKILKDDEKQSELMITSFSLTPATKKGDHYASCMYRARIEYQRTKNSTTSNRALIVKTMPEDESQKAQILQESSLFETEISMYSETLPKIERILAAHGDPTQLAPKLIFSSLEPRKVLIFEDLCEMGYDAVRFRFMTAEELKSVLLKIAKFHAVSYMLGKSEDSKSVTKYQAGILSNSNFADMDFIAGGMKRFMRLLETDKELRAYLPLFQAFDKDLMNNAKQLFRAYDQKSPDDIFVLNHGDFHLKNLMMKFSAENKLNDILLVDFQACVFAPSTIDLTYAIYTLFDPETRREKRDEYMHFYFQHFIVTLRKIGFNGSFPSFNQFQMSSLKYRHYTIFLLVTLLPFMFVMSKTKEEDLKDLDMDKLLLDTDSMMHVYFNPEYVEDVKKLLPVLLNSGYLD